MTINNKYKIMKRKDGFWERLGYETWFICNIGAAWPLAVFESFDKAFAATVEMLANPSKEVA